MILDSVSQIASPSLFLHIKEMTKLNNLFLKLEGLNIAGSIKLKTAISMLQGVMESSTFSDMTKVIESSSGNLGVALSIVCKEQNIPFTCVVDPNINKANLRLMELYGANIIQVTEVDKNGGYLETRIKRIHKEIKLDPNYVWTNQYANPCNPSAHYQTTAIEIAKEFTNVDYLFVGAGTTGTLMGCARYFKEHTPSTQVIAVDALGSVTFSSQVGKRHLPGLGTSLKPKIARLDDVDHVMHISEKETLDTCHRLLKENGLLIGASTGSVLAGVLKYQRLIPKEATVVAISPDFGEKYMHTVYSKEWVKETYGF